jgi:maltooligosyltrehalose trehalohydrolase
LVELAEAVRTGPARERQIHLVLENDHNAAHYLERRANGSPRRYAAQSNDDFHHATHLLATGESDGYYLDYWDRPAARLARCLAEGFAYQGEPSRFRKGVPRGEPSSHLPPTVFVNLQRRRRRGIRPTGRSLRRGRFAAYLLLCLSEDRKDPKRIYERGLTANLGASLGVTCRSPQR